MIKINIDKNKLEYMINIWDLDDGIAELVYIFNEIGFKTIYSCQGHNIGCANINKPYIMFDANEIDIKLMLRKLYDKYSNNYSKYLDIGEINKLCSPCCCSAYDGNYFKINSHWLWGGNNWIYEDYQTKINRFAEYLKGIY